MGSNLKNKAAATEVLDLEGIENWRQVISLELNVDNSTNNSFDMANSNLGLGRV
jgi:hypothetical protein